MRFDEVTVSGAFLISPERRTDESGYFARMFCDQEFTEHGLECTIRQINTGFSPRAGRCAG